jgi:hypothetical protein
MRDAFWLLAIAAMPLFGLLVWRLELVRRMDLAARLSLAFAAGVVFVTTLMYGYALAGVAWTRVSLGVPLVVLAGAGIYRTRNAERRTQNAEFRKGSFLRSAFCVLRSAFASLLASLRDPATLFTLVLLLITLYAIATTRETCADLIYFWGPKGQRFWMKETIDVAFLGFPHYYLMHPDYPPLLPSAYAFASMLVHRFSWWGALYTTLLFLAASAFALRGFTGKSRDALLLTAVLGYAYAVAMVAGGADAVLIFFELVALAALTFGKGERGAYVIASIAMAGAILTKVEGAVFVIVTVGALVLCSFFHRRGRLWPHWIAAVATAVPALILIASWVAFCAKHNLLDSYKKGTEPAHWELTGSVLSNTLRMAGYKAFFLPWLASLAPLVLGRNYRRAALPLLVAAGSLAATLFFYLHIDVNLASPKWWIAASAERVLLTPLMALAVAAAAASE